MIGIIFITALIVWALIALGLSKLLWVIFRFFVNPSQKGIEVAQSPWQTLRNAVLQLLLAMVIFFSPITDEIVAYPKYLEMCQEAGKYEFASSMDSKNAYGREYVMKFKDEKLVSLFPEVRELTNNKKPNSASVKKITVHLIDANTNELILESKIVVPVSSLSAIPWDGRRIPWLLHSCTTDNKESNELLAELKLKQVYRFGSN
ncbi:hypothetical protein MTYP_02243 [Methylophilaceae bacterium]|nr:hypothetical protein MTYP_02243 [Methylophilaceae bacterium]